MNIKRLALLTFAASALATAAYADGPNGGHGGFLKSADLNKDGVIDQTEFQTTRDKWFADLDANKDGFVSADELKAFGDKMHAEWAKKHADQAANQPDSDKTGGKHGDFSQRILKRVDTDKDGKISKAEFDAEGTKLFAKLDENSDGKIASDEMPQRHWARFGGQMFDLEAEVRGRSFSLEDITRLQSMKTGRLIGFSCQAGAILGEAAAPARAALAAYAEDLGLAFQIADDLLDAEGTEAEVGKKVGKDAAAGKATFITHLGLGEARRRANSLALQAAGHLDLFRDKAQILADVARFVVERRA